jgi:hypothetical protein
MVHSAAQPSTKGMQAEFTGAVQGFIHAGSKRNVDAWLTLTLRGMNATASIQPLDVFPEN